jgi:Zn-dependent protease with chaperone function
MSKILALVLLLSLTACGPTLKQGALSKEAVQAEREKQLEMAFVLEATRGDKLNMVAYPMRVAAAPLCGDDVSATTGLWFLDQSAVKPELQAIATRYYKLDGGLTVVYVHPALPAAAAGLQVGDRLLAVNGEDLVTKTTEQANKVFVGILTIKKPGATLAPLTLRIQRGGAITELTIMPVVACKYLVAMANNDAVNALADGKQVIITSGMVKFVESETELALVVGHELAHNALGHISKQRGNRILGGVLDALVMATTGVYTGGAFANAAGTSFSKEFEAEADYAGLYIAARAGYDLKNAANFWRRMGVEHPGSIQNNFGASHPSTPERFTAIEQTILEINGKRVGGQPLLPDRKPEPVKTEVDAIQDSYR